MSGSVVVGVDPGAKGTGLVVIDRGRNDTTLPVPGLARPALVSAYTIRNSGGVDLRVDPAHLDEVAGMMLDEVRRAIDAGHRVAVAVEGILAPNPHLGLTNPAALLVAASVYGVVVHRVPRGVPLAIIRPGRHGSRALGAYPAELVTPAERRGDRWQARVAGKGTRKDQRSAYDVAATALPFLPRIERGLLGPYTY